MKVLVMHDSVHGNTEQTARAVASGLGKGFSVRVVKAGNITEEDLRGMDLLVVGGPTHRHRMSRRLAAVFASMPRKALHGVQVAAFDTRYRMPAWLSGSAAADIARRLRKLRGQLILPPQSFFVTRDIPPKGSKRRHELERMEPGELKRAGLWGAEIANRCVDGRPPEPPGQ
jgi:flavodoxin I